jgi:uncharacterized protein YjbI with pentapeptide repeats
MTKEEALKTIWGSIAFQSTKSTTAEAIREADLSEANFSGANILGADLRGAYLQYCEFYGKGGTSKLTKEQVLDFLAALEFQVEE